MELKNNCYIQNYILKTYNERMCTGKLNKNFRHNINKFYMFELNLNDADHLDFSLLVDFATKCILIKNNILPIDPVIDITNIPTRGGKRPFTFVEYIISIYTTCSKRSYIDINKCRKFWKIYCIIKIITYGLHEFRWDINSFSMYFINAVYNNGMFPTTINGIKYSIYEDFYIYGLYQNFPSEYTVEDQVKYLLNDAITLPCLINNHWDSWVDPISYKMILSATYNSTYVHWNDNFMKFIIYFKDKNYYPKYHPLHIMSNTNICIFNRFIMFKQYFQIHPIDII